MVDVVEGMVEALQEKLISSIFFYQNPHELKPA